MNKSNFKENQKYTYMFLICSRCRKEWAIMNIDVEDYYARVKENVCFDCIPEGW